MWERFLIFCLVLFGVSVGIASLYFASLAGLMGKLGLVGGDLSQTVRREELRVALTEVGAIPACAWSQAVAPVPQYLFSQGSERIQLGFVLGERRIACSLTYILSGNIERGIYTMLKGLYYERANHLALLRLVEQDTQHCALYDPNRSYGYVEVYLQSAEGNARDSILPVFDETQRLRQQVSERCIDAPSVAF